MNKKLKKLLVSIIFAGLISVLFYLGLFDRVDAIFSDPAYNRIEAADGEIVIIGMDQKAIEEFGPMPWPRDIMADAIAYLNSDEDLKPAVIGVDVLYVGQSADEGADDYLAEVCQDGGNVVMASAATFGSKLVEQGSGFYLDDRAVLAFDMPYPKLANASKIGHINAMADEDSGRTNPIRHVKRQHISCP